MLNNNDLVFRVNGEQASQLRKLLPESPDSVRLVRLEVIGDHPNTDVYITSTVRATLLSRLNPNADQELLRLLWSPQSLENQLCRDEVLYILHITKNQNTWTFDLTAAPDSARADRQLLVSCSEGSMTPHGHLGHFLWDGFNISDHFDTILGIDEHPNMLIIATSAREFIFRDYKAEHRRIF